MAVGAPGTIDVNNSGNVNAMKAFLKTTFNKNKTFREVFDKADENGSGGLDKEELSKLLSSYGMNSLFSVEDVMSACGKSVGRNDDCQEVSMNHILTYASHLGFDDWTEDTTIGDAIKSVKEKGGELGVAANQKPDIGV